MKELKIIVFLSLLLFLGACASNQKKSQDDIVINEPKEIKIIEMSAKSEGLKPLPVYLSELSNLNDYSIFANAGWDGNWYVGYDVCWIEELPPAPQGEFSKAFVGVKLGRMKTRAVKGRPIWEKEPIEGEIYIGISDKPAWKSSDQYLLTETKDVPLEGDPENGLEGVGESQWFWAEVPVTKINFVKSNFVAVWSPTEFFTNTSTCPILAGGWGSKRVNSWMNQEIKGYPPVSEKDSKNTGITIFEPAIAIKLIPRKSKQKVKVTISDIVDGRKKTPNMTFIANVKGDMINRAWIEISYGGGEWEKHGRYIYTPPYQFTLNPKYLKPGRIRVRCVARDVWESEGRSDSIEVKVSK